MTTTTTAAVPWHEGPVVGFDLETTGTDVFDDRIVTAAIIHHTPGQRPRALTWLINPGTDIPDEAAQVHGWTTRRLLDTLDGHQAAFRIGTAPARSCTRDGALAAIAAQLGLAFGQGVPVVAANAAFDLTILEAELARHDVDTLTSRPKGVTGVVDPMVIEKHYDPYRKVKGGCTRGKLHDCDGCGAEDKTLAGLCTHYGVPLPGAHDASVDALAAVRLTRRLAGMKPELARWRLATLHQKQIEWRAEQCGSLRAYFDRAGVEHDGVCGEWPVHRACAARAVVSVGVA